MTFCEKSLDFTLKIFKEISSIEQNSFFSPFSIVVALTMPYVGADGITKDEMNKVLFSGESPNEEEINESVLNILNLLENTDDCILRIANRLFCEKSYQILQNYLDVIGKYFRSECLPVDFKNKSNEVCTEINKWVEKITEEKIRNLLAPNAMNEETRLILVNAIYFKGDWKHAFREENTNKKPFYAAENKQFEVDMMFATLKHLKYSSDEKYQILGMPYKAENLMMYFILPTERYGLESFEKQLTSNDFLAMVSSCSSAEVKVELPKFKMEQSFDLVKVLSKMGMPSAFTNNANFSKISADNDLCISAVVHKAFVEVNEKGTEAAAATAVLLRKKRCARHSAEPLSFIADHPFLFALVEEKSNSILFLGHYYGW